MMLSLAAAAKMLAEALFAGHGAHGTVGKAGPLRELKTLELTSATVMQVASRELFALTRKIDDEATALI